MSSLGIRRGRSWVTLSLCRVPNLYVIAFMRNNYHSAYCGAFTSKSRWARAFSKKHDKWESACACNQTLLSICALEWLNKKMRVRKEERAHIRRETPVVESDSVCT